MYKYFLFSYCLHTYRYVLPLKTSKYDFGHCRDASSNHSKNFCFYAIEATIFVYNDSLLDTTIAKTFIGGSRQKIIDVASLSESHPNVYRFAPHKPCLFAIETQNMFKVVDVQQHEKTTFLSSLKTRIRNRGTAVRTVRSARHTFKRFENFYIA